MKYEEELIIDINALDEEWLHQPQLFMKYAELAAEAEAEAKKAHEKIKIIRSQLIKLAQSDPEKHISGGKATDKNVEAFYRDHEDHKKAKEEFIEAEYRRDLFTSAKSAFYQRKSSLENLVILHGQQYFAGPSVPREHGQAMKEKVEETKSERVARRKSVRSSRRAE